MNVITDQLKVSKMPPVTSTPERVNPAHRQAKFMDDVRSPSHSRDSSPGGVPLPQQKPSASNAASAGRLALSNEAARFKKEAQMHRSASDLEKGISEEAKKISLSARNESWTLSSLARQKSTISDLLLEKESRIKEGESEKSLPIIDIDSQISNLKSGMAIVESQLEHKSSIDS